MTFLLIRTKLGLFDYVLRIGHRSPLELVRVSSSRDSPRPEPEPVYGVGPMPFPGALQFIMGLGPSAHTCYLDVKEITLVSQEAI